MRAIELLEPEAAVLTPSYAAHLVEWAADRGIDLAGSSVERVLVAGEPGGGEPAFRRTLEEGWGARVTEAMGIGDIGVSLWGECEAQDGMHLGARDYVHPELIDPANGAAKQLDDGASGELVLTHLRHRAAPLLRFRTRDHIVVRTGPCPCGRTSPRVRCVGRTDDMLIVRGVNVFPAAVREVVSSFAPDVSGHILVRPQAPGVKQEPPLPVRVELARGARADEALAEAIGEKLRTALVVRTRVELVPWGTLQRSEYKSKLVEHEPTTQETPPTCASPRARGPTTSRSSARTGRRRSTSGRACSACRSSSISRTSTTRRRATCTSTPATGGSSPSSRTRSACPIPSARRRTPAACTTSRSRSRRRRSPRPSSASTSAASATAA